MKLSKVCILIITLLFFQIVLIKPVWATTFDLIAPSGELSRGQEVRFTITIDTQGTSLSSTTIGMTYDTQYLEFLNVIPGDTFTTINVDQLGGGKLLISGTSDSSSPYSGSGVFAYVSFRIIATSPGSTEICALFNPSPTPSTAPTASPTGGPQPTSPPQPTAMPKSGENKPALFAGILGLIFITPAFGAYIMNKSNYSFIKRRKKTS